MSVPDIDGVGLVLFDFDGVFTDNRVAVSQDGRESVTCHRGDGWGVARLVESGMPVEIVSSETNAVVAARARKLGIRCTQGLRNKLEATRDATRRHGVDPTETLYVGNDLNDLPSMLYVGVSVAVADAHPRVISAATFVTEARGGHGAVREVCEALVDCTPTWEQAGV